MYIFMGSFNETGENGDQATTTRTVKMRRDTQMRHPW